MRCSAVLSVILTPYFSVSRRCRRKMQLEQYHRIQTILLLPLPPLPPRLRVNRTYFRFGRYKNHRRPHSPPHPLLTPSRSPSPTAVRSTNRLTLRGSILGPRPPRPKWAHTTVSFPGCTAREGKSALNVTLNWALPPPTPASHLLFHQPLSPSAVNRGRPPSYLLLNTNDCHAFNID
jgi:hypothetical protein